MGALNHEDFRMAILIKTVSTGNFKLGVLKIISKGMLGIYLCNLILGIWTHNLELWSESKTQLSTGHFEVADAYLNEAIAHVAIC